MKTWQKVAIGAGALVGAYALYSAGKSSAKPTKSTKKVTSPPPGAPIPTPDPPEPQAPEGEESEEAGEGEEEEAIGGSGEGQVLPPGSPGYPAAQVVDQQDFPTSDNPNISAPVTGKIYKLPGGAFNPKGKFRVRFEHANGILEFQHKTLEGAQLRLDSTVNKPVEWTCQATYDNEYDAWVCTDNINPGEFIARGFLDLPAGPSPWFVTWDGEKFLLFKVPDLSTPPEPAGEFNELPEAMDEAVG
jgi:hypothetical protein